MYTNIVLKMMKNGGKKMNSKIIKRSVESHFNTKIDEKTRKREIVYMRSIYFKLCRELTFESLDKIGKRVGLDHATVLHGIKIFDTIIDNFWEKELFNRYLFIKENLKTKVSLEVRRKAPNKFYKNKYRIKLLQNKKLYNYTKECISKLEQMEYKYSDVLRKKLNDIINDKKYVAKQN